MRKKLLVLLLSLVLCVSLLPIGAMAAVNGSGILLVMVGDTQVTDKMPRTYWATAQSPMIVPATPLS